MDDEQAKVAAAAIGETLPNPTIAEELTAAALTAASDSPTLADRLRAGPPTNVTMREEVAGAKATPKPRGRPPGSRNKAKDPSTPTQPRRRGVGGDRPIIDVKVTEPDDGLTTEERHAAKLAKAEKYAVMVSETVNDNLLMILMSMGCPANFLYTEGNAPKQVVENQKYTDLAKQLTMDPKVSEFVGRFLAEMETTGIGGSVAGAVQDGKAPLIIYGILSLAGIVQWGRGLADAYKTIGPMLEQYKAYQAAQAAQRNQENIQQTGGIAP